MEPEPQAELLSESINARSREGGRRRGAARRGWLVAVAVASLALMGVRCPVDGPLRAGVCSVDITPISPSLLDEYESTFGVSGAVNHTDPVYIAGFGNDRQATGYNDQIWARGTVVDGSDGRVAIVSVDLIGYFNAEVETIRSLIDPDAGIDYVVVSSTHQHEGPDTLGIWGPDATTSGIDFGYLDFVNQSVADCINDAVDNMQPARVKYAKTDGEGLSLGLDPEDDGFGVADSRVLVDDDLLAPETEGRIIDPRLSIMQITEHQEPFAPLATLVNFASHPEALGSDNTLITSDFPHYARERIEELGGGLAIWVSGAVGVLQGPLRLDVEDPDTGLPAPRRTYRWAEVHGQQLADRVMESIPQDKRGMRQVRVEAAEPERVFLPLANPYFRFFIGIGVLPSGLFTAGELDDSVGFPFPAPFDVIPQALGEDLGTEVGAFRIGEGSFVVVPSELDPQIGEAYRELMSGSEHTFIIGLGNDEVGYQLPAEKWDDSCHACAPFVLGGVPEFCPLFPNINCDTIFQNNVGQQVDPEISASVEPMLERLHDPNRIVKNARDKLNETL
ncbi:MAG: neutral/alkaline non-lysosomal ceramidase N-terminal domain-containing protein [Myxococcota bacterium]